MSSDTYELFGVDIRTEDRHFVRNAMSRVSSGALMSQPALEDALEHNGFIVLRILGAVDESDYTPLPGGGDGRVDCTPGGRMP